MVYVDESALERLLEKAARAHAKHRAEDGHPGAHWPSFYASFIVKRLEEHDEKD